MNDYSDLIYLMGAIVVFSLLSLQTNRIFQLNNRIQMNSELEYNGISIAQDEIDRLRWIKNKTQFNVHLNTFPKVVPLAIEDDTLYYNVDMTATDINIPDSNVENKKVTVNVRNDFVQANASDTTGQHSVKLEFVKSF